MQKKTERRHFTVVIPTRERYDTLGHALHTCVIQNYDNLEIIVSDNFRQDHTPEIVESCKVQVCEHE
ncbi:glycosyltransferase family A protein [Chloroflexota bacterium]